MAFPQITCNHGQKTSQKWYNAITPSYTSRCRFLFVFAINAECLRRTIHEKQSFEIKSLSIVMKNKMTTFI